MPAASTIYLAVVMSTTTELQTQVQSIPTPELRSHKWLFSFLHAKICCSPLVECESCPGRRSEYPSCGNIGSDGLAALSFDVLTLEKLSTKEVCCSCWQSVHWTGLTSCSPRHESDTSVRVVDRLLRFCCVRIIIIITIFFGNTSFFFLRWSRKILFEPAKLKQTFWKKK